MSAITIIVLTLVIMTLATLIFQWYLWKERKFDKEVIDEHWQKFLKADYHNDIKGINSFGDKLIWNRHIETHQLNRIMKVVNSRVKDYPELEKLDNAVFNKIRHYQRPFPGSGGGGINQSW